MQKRFTFTYTKNVTQSLTLVAKKIFTSIYTKKVTKSFTLVPKRILTSTFYCLSRDVKCFPYSSLPVDSPNLSDVR